MRNCSIPSLMVSTATSAVPPVAALPASRRGFVFDAGIDWWLRIPDSFVRHRIALVVARLGAARAAAVAILGYRSLPLASLARGLAGPRVDRWRRGVACASAPPRSEAW